MSLGNKCFWGNVNKLKLRCFSDGIQQNGSRTWAEKEAFEGFSLRVMFERLVLLPVGNKVQCYLIDIAQGISLRRFNIDTQTLAHTFTPWASIHTNKQFFVIEGYDLCNTHL